MRDGVRGSANTFRFVSLGRTDYFTGLPSVETVAESGPQTVGQTSFAREILSDPDAITCNHLPDNLFYQSAYGRAYLAFTRNRVLSARKHRIATGDKLACRHWPRSSRSVNSNELAAALSQSERRW